MMLAATKTVSVVGVLGRLAALGRGVYVRRSATLPPALQRATCGLPVLAATPTALATRPATLPVATCRTL